MSQGAGPAPIMAANLPTQQDVNNFNFWAKYRDPDAQDFDAQQMQNLHQANYQRPAPPPPPAVPLCAGWVPVVVAPQPAPNAAEQILINTFLNSQPAELASLQDAALAANWRSTKLLGSGNGGLVGLWECRYWGSYPTSFSHYLVVSSNSLSQISLTHPVLGSC